MAMNSINFGICPILGTFLDNKIRLSIGIYNLDINSSLDYVDVYIILLWFCKTNQPS